MIDNSDSADNVKLLLGAQIRSIRNDKQLKISDLADMTGLTASTISQIERGLISPSISTLKKICDAIQIPIGYLFENVDKDSSSANHINLAQEAPIPAPTVNPAGDMDAYLRSFPPLNLMGHSPVVHKENRKFLSPGEGMRFYLLNPTLSGPVELIYNEYDPGATTGPGLYSHPGCECGLILSGELIIQIKDAVYTLKEGDSITFNCTDPHLKKNESDKMCTCIWANVPPWF